MKLRTIIIIALCICAGKLFSQDAGEINALLLNLKKVNTDTARANIYSRLCFTYCTFKPDSAFWYGKQAMDLSTKINYARGIADAYNTLGWAYYSAADYTKAKNYFNEALTRFKKTGNKNLIAAPLSNLGNVYLQESNYPLALSYFKQSFDYYEEAGNEASASQDLYSMGRIYNLQKNPAKAREYFQQSLNIEKKSGNDLFVAQALGSIANSYQFEEKFDTALIYYKQVLPVFIKHNDFYRTGNTYENMAAAYMNKKQYRQGEQYLLKAKEFYRKINSKTDIAYVDAGLIEAYSNLNNINNAVNAYNEAMPVIKEINDKSLEQEIKKKMSQSFRLYGDYKNAYLYLDSSDRIKDSLFTKDKQDELLKLQTEFETERKEKENQQLKTQNLSSTLKLERNKEWLIATIAALLIAGILLYALYKNRQAKIKNIKNLQALNAKLEEQTEEISRINNILELKALRAQMNPHFIFNCMSSIQECMLLGRIDDANSYLTKLSRLLRMVLNYSDEESISLDKELQMLNLYLQLEKIRLKNNFEYTIEVNEDIVTEELQVPALILQPFAENAIWHGLVNKKDNRCLSIKGNIKNDVLCFIISDNGIGRKKAEELNKDVRKHQSKGISLIEKRLSIINKNSNVADAGFTIKDLYNEAQQATGTSVEIRLPLVVI